MAQEVELEIGKAGTTVCAPILSNNCDHVCKRCMVVDRLDLHILLTQVSCKACTCRQSNAADALILHIIGIRLEAPPIMKVAQQMKEWQLLHRKEA